MRAEGKELFHDLSIPPLSVTRFAVSSKLESRNIQTQTSAQRRQLIDRIKVQKLASCVNQMIFAFYLCIKYYGYSWKPITLFSCWQISRNKGEIIVPLCCLTKASLPSSSSL